MSPSHRARHQYNLILTSMASTKPNRRGAQGKGGARRNENNRIYANPLPLIFSPSNDAGSSWSLRNPLGLLSISRHGVLNPHCVGVYDAATRSVWITNSKDSTILWRRGFFGKGDLSRSEPSWLTRQVNAKKAAANNRSYSDLYTPPAMDSTN